ncbi:predicted protein [Arabidopsis lyrata subsp. lyrata]|uniref:Predicted protein n=1 Tax=Arabidopsis lyrata subsp. lyrata TaxID=81972 RepID=D7M158_ARALL|nr:predicted protein [Arabidopsis lyrata subsp. lyrata]
MYDTKFRPMVGLGINDSNVFAPIGYWPENFTCLTDYVQWDSEIVNKNIYGWHTII